MTAPGIRGSSRDMIGLEGSPDAPAGIDVDPDEEGKGWSAIAEWTGGLDPDAVDDLREIQGLAGAYPLLHALVGRSLREFLVRAAALKAIVSEDQASLKSDDLKRCLYWLDEDRRDATLRALRANGWLAYEPSSGTSVTDEGRWVYEIVSFLHKQLAERELSPTVAGIEYAMKIGVDPVWHLSSLRSRLLRLMEDIDSAMASHSEVVLTQAAGRIGDALGLSEQIRAALDRVPLENRAGRLVSRDIHDLLSRLHGRNATLHAAIAEVGRQHLRLTAGLRPDQIVRALMAMSLGELATAGRAALVPVPRHPPLVNTDVLASAAEQQILRERRETTPVVWREPGPMPERPVETIVPAEATALLSDLARILHEGKPGAFADVVPRGNAAESFLRASLLPLVGDQRSGEGVAGQLGNLALDVEPRGDGWAEPLPGGLLEAMSPGEIVPRKGKAARG
jgi:hypothetical protein